MGNSGHVRVRDQAELDLLRVEEQISSMFPSSKTVIDSTSDNEHMDHTTESWMNNESPSAG
ncbi:hypothetical protein INR49_013929 [Caranx melampygus]|nr:hypothetical protein INR49_013929 [Caranx melampygus]